MKILLDPGHGGWDGEKYVTPGKRSLHPVDGSWYYEGVENRKIALMWSDILEKHGHDVYFTVDPDDCRDISLTERVKIADALRPDLMHCGRIYLFQFIPMVHQIQMQPVLKYSPRRDVQTFRKGPQIYGLMKCPIVLIYGIEVIKKPNLRWSNVQNHLQFCWNWRFTRMMMMFVY
jgi:hypothetical protein